MLQKILNSKIILYVLIAVLAYFLFENYQHRKQLESSLKTLETSFKEQRQEREKDFDSIEKLIHFQDENISDINFELAKLDKSKADINSKNNEEKHRVNNLPADSLEQFFADRYSQRQR